MLANITLKTTIRVNGKEYARVDDMPPAIRQAYERAMASLQSGALRGAVDPATTSADTPVRSIITFNGQEFDSPEAMPPAIRKLYDELMVTLETEQRPGRGGVLQAPPSVDGSLSVSEASLAANAARPESTTARMLIAGVVIAVLLLVSLVLRH